MDNNIALENYDFDITECNNINLNDGSYKKLNLSSIQTAQLNMFLHEIPTITASAALGNAYRVSFPKGLPHTLMKLKNGQSATPIMGKNGIVGSAGLVALGPEAVILLVFSALSIVTGQYFLAEINKKFDLVNEKLDTIISFLYGDKKAELMSEINFVQNANKNYNSIMMHEEQRLATIIGLQQAQKTAMKDIEFYLSDLDEKTDSKKQSSTENMVNDLFQIKESLELSMQLYTLSSVLEAFYSQNFDVEYLSFISQSASYYINKCEKRILSDFSKLNNHLKEIKPNAIKNVISKQDNSSLIERVELVITSLNGGENSPMLKSVEEFLNNSLIRNYYITNNCEIYIKENNNLS